MTAATGRVSRLTINSGRGCYLQLESCGAEFIYDAVDVCDLAGLQKVAAAAEARWRERLSGIIHLAGEGSLAEHWYTVDRHWVTAEEPRAIEAMFQAKVYGTWTVWQLTKDPPDAVFISFSSVNGTFGGASLSAYSAANSFLDGYAHLQRRRGRSHVYCFSWSMWDNLGMSCQAADHVKSAVRALGYHVLSKEQGLQSLIAGLARHQQQLIVDVDGANRQMRRRTHELARPTKKIAGYFTAGRRIPAGEWRNLVARDRFQAASRCEFLQLPEMPLTPAGAVDRQKLALLDDARTIGALERVAPRNATEARLSRIWRDLLGTEQPSIHDNSFMLGGHSLLVPRVLARVRKEFSVELPLRVLFQAPTISGLAESIERVREGGTF